ncbi:MBL fold metallo-hydrolase [Flavilitoribacter nigricans]|nr:MBL fold metallo-hydrolase [Flavilitoribacter nigricans]
MKEEPVWQIRFYGARGSTPVCEKGFQLFGGNTTCIYADLLINDRSKMIVIFDAGTGIRKLGREIMQGLLPETEFIFLVFTHFHWDHIQGFPFFDPAYDPNKKIAIFFPRDEMKDQDLKHIFEVQMQKEYFPVPLNRMGADLQFFTAEEYENYLKMEEYVDFKYLMHCHPSGAFSYRMEACGRSVVICTDLEHGTSINPEVVAFCRDADLLIHDAQYTDEQLNEHRGWGHSSYSQAVAVAELANAKQLIFTHHDPDHDDEFLLAVVEKYQKIFPNCALAREGMEVCV